MYPQQYNHEDQEEQQEESDPVPKVDPRVTDDAAKSIDAASKAKQYQEEDEARFKEIQKKFDEKTKDMAKRYAQAYNGGVLHSDFDESKGVLAKETAKLKEEEQVKKEADEALK